MVEGLARKAEWIMELVRTNQLAFSVAVSVISPLTLHSQSASYNQLLPIAQVARDEAAM